MAKKATSKTIGFEANSLEQKDKMFEIAKKNNRTLAGQLNHMMDECIAEHEAKAKE